MRLIDIILELEYLSEKIDANTQADLKNLIASDTESLAENLSLEIQKSITTASEYDSSAATESDLRSRLTSVNQSITEFGEAGEAILDYFTPTLSRLNIAFPDELNATYPITFSESLNRFTRFSAPEFGSMNINSTFTFQESYDFLNSVFEFAQPAPGTQTASNANQ
ncbi:hypothetical protein [Marinobacter sp.]|uniref:hypothetical protein n=1 Tax=Marinobacter sp. TaxID=50741 RepID=UPI003A8DF213